MTFPDFSYIINFFYFILWHYLCYIHQWFYFCNIISSNSCCTDQWFYLCDNLSLLYYIIPWLFSVTLFLDFISLIHRSMVVFHLCVGLSHSFQQYIIYFKYIGPWLFVWCFFPANTVCSVPQVWCDVEMLGWKRENQTKIWRPHSHHQRNHPQHWVWLAAEGWPGRDLHKRHPAPHAGLSLPRHAHQWGLKERARMMSTRHWCTMKHFVVTTVCSEEWQILSVTEVMWTNLKLLAQQRCCPSNDGTILMSS